MKTAWIIIFGATLLWSGIEPKDRLTWFLEAGPAIIGLIVMGITRKSFPLTPPALFLDSDSLHRIDSGREVHLCGSSPL